MKSVFAFVTVCCLAATAGAGLQLTVNGVATNETTIQVGGELTIGVVNDSIASVYELILFISWGQPGEWILPPIQSDIPGLIINSWGWVYFEDKYIGSGWTNVFDTSVVKPIVGIMGEFGYRCTGLGDVSIDLFNMKHEILDGWTIHQIPEPATLALFGVGIALIRRRIAA